MDEWMNINCHSIVLNCFDSLVLQSAAHMLRMFADHRLFDIMRLFDIRRLEHKLSWDLWLSLLDNESLAPRAWVSLLVSEIPGEPYEQKLHLSSLAQRMSPVNVVLMMQIFGFPNIQVPNTHA